MTAVIEVAGLTKRYGGQAVVDGISFQVEQGEIFGILGPNGAGKTTAVECMEGLRQRDSGQVRILGLDPRTDGHRLHQRIGVQLQETQLQDKLKVREALELYASFYPHPADWRKMLERWGLASKSEASFAKLSGGQKQRLFIALALVGDPEVVFLDELTSGLDPGARRATPLDEQSLAALPGVRSVTRRGTQVDIGGTGDFASAVTAELARRQVVVAGLRIEGRSLDSAYVALTGQSMDM
jgi:ABC-type multidrug transport system ATPase subunit